MTQETEVPNVTQADIDLASWFTRRMPGYGGAQISRLLARHRLSHSTPGDAEVREDQVETAALAFAREFYGPGFDPFQNPEAYDMAEKATRAALALIATPSGHAQTWQPIETAPRGSVVLVTDGRSVYAAEYNLNVYGADYPWVLFDGVFGHRPTGCCDREDDCRIEVNGWPDDGPTHWQPLPAAPPAQDQGEGR